MFSAVPRLGYGSKTEVLLNFICMAFSRAGGFLDIDNPNPQHLATLARLDTVLGGAWWRQMYRSAGSGGQAVGQLVDEYAHQVCVAVNSRRRGAQGQECRATLIPVRNTQEQEVPVYWLLHFTFHPDGTWCIAEAAAKANAEWRNANNQLALSKRLARDARAEQIDLFADEDLIPRITEEVNTIAEPARYGSPTPTRTRQTPVAVWRSSA